MGHMSLSVALGLILTVAALNFSGAEEGVLKHSTVRLLFTSGQCLESRKESRAELFLGNDQLREFFSLQNSRQFGVGALTLPVVDFSKEHLLLLSMGERPTAGYGISLSQEKLLYSKNEAEIDIVWDEPSANAVVAQIITSPCVLLAIPKQEYKVIKVTDQYRISRWMLHIP